MGPRDLLQLVSGELTRLGIRHFVTGSMGSMVYGEYRSTIDVDIVADVASVHVPALRAAFPEPDHYLSEAAMRQAIDRTYIEQWADPLRVLDIWRTVIEAADSESA